MRTNSRMSLGHTLRATCGTLPSNENELLTRHLAMRTNSSLTPCKQGAVHFFPAQFANKNPPEELGVGRYEFGVVCMKTM